MTSSDIYSILQSIPHNPHYLKRYYNFIVKCNDKNINLEKDSYVEKHHICPRAKDLFPEYSSLRINKWNSVKLTSRQHFIAHWILWKTYKTYSTNKAFLWMCNSIDKENSDTKRNNIKINSNFYEIAKQEFSKNQKGKVNAKNLLTGICGWITKEEFEKSPKHIVGCNHGHRFTKTESMRNALKGPQSEDRAKETRKRIITMTTTKIVCDIITKKEYSINGWSTHLKSLYDEDFIKNKALNLSKYMTGRKRSKESVEKFKISNSKHKQEYIERMIEHNKWRLVSDIITRKVYSIATFTRHILNKKQPIDLNNQ